MAITLPHNFKPRDYQLPVLQALDAGKKRAACVWHRRSGKDKTFLNYTIKSMFERVGSYYYLFPNYNQGRKIMWDGIGKDGFPFMKHFPKPLVKSKNNTEMKLTTVNSSIFQIVGTDNIDSIMGTNPVGCIFSEYALQDTRAWDFIRPIVRENGGWTVFNYTPRGRNHGYILYKMALENRDWFSELLTIDDTFLPNGRPVVTRDMVQADREEGMEESLVLQEYWCSFDAALQACFFGNTLVRHKDTLRGLKGDLGRTRNGDLVFEKNRRGVIEIWRFPYYLHKDFDGLYWTNRYVLGSDVGEGTEGTYSVAYIFDRVLDEFVCRMRSNKIDAYSWADMIHALTQYYDNALACIERTGAGITTVKRAEQLKVRQYMKKVPAKVGSGMTKQIGWSESRQAKYELAGDLKEYYRSTRGTVYDTTLLDESATFIKTEGGRLEHDQGFMDDCVIGAGCAIQAHFFVGSKPRKSTFDSTPMWYKKWAKESGRR